MGTGPFALAANLQPAAVNLDHCQSRPCLDWRLKLMGLKFAHM